MSSDHSRPLQEELIAPVGFVLADMIIRVGELETQAVEFADIPSQIRRIADRLLAGTHDAGRIIEEKARGPVFV